jgi:7-cyano-7-deazaguanine synthase
MKLHENRALVVFSGGQDSTTCLGWALHYFDEVFCVSFDYGQKHAIELEAAAAVIRFFESKDALGRKIPHEIVKLPEGVFAGISPLTNKAEQLETYKSHDEMEAVIGDRIEKTFVPMRNAVFLMLAANRAAVLGCGQLVTGVCQADNANYPDCRQDFVDSAEETINEALGFSTSECEWEMLVQTPLMNRSKAEAIELALTLPSTYAALAYSHTAYNGVYPPTGQDHASVLRAHGFEQARMPDPLVLRAWGEGHMELPESANYDPVRAMPRDAVHDWLFRHPTPAPLEA